MIEFERDHPRFNGLAEPNIVGDEEVDPGHLNGPHHGIELVVLDFDAGAEGRLDGPYIGQGGGSPPDGIEKGVELIGRIEAGRLREAPLFQRFGRPVPVPK